MTDDHVDAAPDSAPIGTEAVALVRLDELIEATLAPEHRPFLKLDIQGFELEALYGAEGALERIPAIELELSLVELYRGQPLLGEVFEWLRTKGYRCISVEPEFISPSTGHLLQVNGLFVRQ